MPCPGGTLTHARAQDSLLTLIRKCPFQALSSSLRGGCPLWKHSAEVRGIYKSNQISVRIKDSGRARRLSWGGRGEGGRGCCALVLSSLTSNYRLIRRVLQTHPSDSLAKKINKNLCRDKRSPRTCPIFFFFLVASSSPPSPPLRKYS